MLLNILKIGLACLMGAAALASDTKSEVEHWLGSGLSAAYLSGFISDDKCYSSRDYLLSCVNAVDRAGGMLNPPREVTASNLLADKSSRARDPHAPRTWQTFYAEKKARARDLRNLTEEWWSVYIKTGKRLLNIEGSLKVAASFLPADVPAEMLRGNALTAHLQTFDPHAYALPASLVEERQRRNLTGFMGIGVNLDFVSAGVLIHEVFPHSPAAAAGVREDDRLLAVARDGRVMQSLAGLDPQQVYGLLAGAENEPLAMRLVRDGREQTVTIKRGPVFIPDVFSEMTGLNKSTGYIQLRSFESLDSCRSVRERLDALKALGAKSYILDLRGNAGGEKSMALCVAGLFLGAKVKIVRSALTDLLVPSLQGLFDSVSGFSEDDNWEKTTTARVTDAPLVVLVNALSASASELVAGALQENRRAWIVGERTSGKSSIQFTRSPDNNPGLSIARTGARFTWMKNGGDPRFGVYPNFEIPLRRNASPDDRFYPREEDLFPPAVPVPVPAWVDPRAGKSGPIAVCIATGAVDDAELAGLDANGRPDFQKAYALAVLKCL